MSQLEAWALAYLIAWTVAGHLFAGWAVKTWRKHHRRSKAAQKGALTRRRKGITGKGSPAKPAPKPRAKKPKPLEDKVITTDSAWFEVEEDEPDYNEQVGVPWTPTVRRFNGGAHEYAKREEIQ